MLKRIQKCQNLYLDVFGLNIPFRLRKMSRFFEGHLCSIILFWTVTKKIAVFDVFATYIIEFI